MRWLILSLAMWLAGSGGGSVHADSVSPVSGWYPPGTGEAMEVYRRAKCGDIDMAKRTAYWASKRGLPAQVVAAIVVVESRCDAGAVSRDGSVGLMQVRIETWQRTLKFEPGEMLNADKSLEVGTEILRRMVERYGLEKGIERYNGQGERARRYRTKVLNAAGESQIQNSRLRIEGAGCKSD